MRDRIIRTHEKNKEAAEELIANAELSNHSVEEVTRAKKTKALAKSKIK